MAVDNLTLVLNGEVSLAQFAKAIRNFSALVEAITQHEAPEPVRWIIDDLKPGSASTTAWGDAQSSDAVASVVRTYVRVGNALVDNTVVFPFPDVIERPAREITSLLNGQITSIRFESPEEEVTVTKGRQLPQRTRSAYGAVTGTIETLQRRRGLKFSLYDDLFDRAVSCYLHEGQEEALRDLWGKHAIVAGWVSRDPMTGAPTSVRRIDAITPMVDEPGGYRAARGAVPLTPGMESATDVIRRLRDD